jgi:hypothetical protein
MAKINYTDKVDSTTRNVPNINKVTAEDMNEIKASVNVNVDNIALKADLNGNNTNVFRVATAVGVDDAVTKAQLDASVTSVSAIDVSLNDTSLVVAKETNVQAFAETADAALLRARGTGVATTYTSSVSTGGTVFAQGAVSGEINGDQGYFNVIYAGATGVTVTNLTSANTFVYIDNAGVLSQQNTEPTREDFVRKVFTMRIAVDTSTNLILGFEYLNNPIGHYTNSQRDLYSFLLAAGVPFRKDQLITGRATDLGFDVSAGSFLEFGGTGDIYNPNIPPVAAVINATFTLSTRTGFDTGGNTDLPKFWDNNGTLTALGSTTLVGHRLYRFSNGNFVLQYGQGNYANMTLAKVGARLEEYVLNPALKNATFFGWWFIESTATNTGGTTLTDFIEYTIGVSGGSSNTLSGCLLKGNNLSDLLDAAAARTNLGVTALDNANVKLTGNQSIAGIKTFTDVINGTRGSFSQSSSLATVNGYNGFASGIGVSGGAANGNAGYFVNNSTTYPVLKLLGLSETDLIQGRGTNDAVTFSVTSSGEATFASSISATDGNFSGLVTMSDRLELSDALNNSFIGEDSGVNNTTGNFNVSLGYQSLNSNTTSSENISLGRQSLYLNTTGSQNIALGGDSLYSITTGYQNIALGSQSLYSNTTGYQNIALGIASGKYIADGVTLNEISNNSIFIGSEIRANANNQNNQIVIGDSAIGNGSNTVTLGGAAITDTYLKGNVQASGSVSANTFATIKAPNSDGGGTLNLENTTTSINGTQLGKFNFIGNDSSTGANGIRASIQGISESFNGQTSLVFRTADANTTESEAFRISFNKSATFVSSITATAFNTSSDYRLKEDLKDFNGLEIISNIPVYDYKWKKDESRSYGVMAHELQGVLPYAVTSEKDAEEIQAVDYSKIVPLLIKSIQELKAEIELLKNK